MPLPMDKTAALDAILKKHKGENKAVQPDLVEDTEGEMDDFDLAAEDIMSSIHNKNTKAFTESLKAFLSMHSMKRDPHDDDEYPSLD